MKSVIADLYGKEISVEKSEMGREKKFVQSGLLGWNPAPNEAIVRTETLMKSRVTATRRSAQSAFPLPPSSQSSRVPKARRDRRIVPGPRSSERPEAHVRDRTIEKDFGVASGNRATGWVKLIQSEKIRTP